MQPASFYLAIASLLALPACVDPITGRIDPVRTSALGTSMSAMAGVNVASASTPRKPFYSPDHGALGGGPRW